MKTLASFILIIMLILVGTRAHQWRRNTLAEAKRTTGELQLQLNEVNQRFEGYWPRFERMEEALGITSNALVRLTAELIFEKEANKPLRSQIETLSAERIAQAAREQTLRKDHDAAVSSVEQLKGSVEDVRTRQVEAEDRRKALEEQVKTLEEGIRSRDSDLAQTRARLDRQTVEFNRLQEANKSVAELQNQLTTSKTERDEVVGGRNTLQKELDDLRKERDALQKERDALRMVADAKAVPAP